MDKNFDNFGIMANTGISPNAFLMNEIANQNTQTAELKELLEKLEKTQCQVGILMCKE